jgi:hypothetical protein
MQQPEHRCEPNRTATHTSANLRRAPWGLVAAVAARAILLAADRSAPARRMRPLHDHLFF